MRSIIVLVLLLQACATSVTTDQAEILPVPHIADRPELVEAWYEIAEEIGVPERCLGKGELVAQLEIWGTSVALADYHRETHDPDFDAALGGLNSVYPDRGRVLRVSTQYSDETKIPDRLVWMFYGHEMLHSVQFCAFDQGGHEGSHWTGLTWETRKQKQDFFTGLADRYGSIENYAGRNGVLLQ